MKIKIIILIITILALAVVGFFRLRGENRSEKGYPGQHRVKAREVIQSGQFTYVRVSEGKKTYWCALNQMDVEKGKTYYWRKGWEMDRFHSRELDRTFTNVYFLETLSDRPIQAEQPVTDNFMTGRQIVPERPGIQVEKAEGGITIAELYANRRSYAGKPVKIRGEVVKFSKQIMDRNWVHVQDGTKDGESYDLTVTTQDTASIGATHVFEGVITLDMDFGAGYTYPVIMEGARVR